MNKEISISHLGVEPKNRKTVTKEFFVTLRHTRCYCYEIAVQVQGAGKSIAHIKYASVSVNHVLMDNGWIRQPLEGLPTWMTLRNPHNATNAVNRY